jgi:hypothetical protein
MSDMSFENTQINAGITKRIKPIIKLRKQPLPVIKYSDVKEKFSTPSYYFSTTSITNQINSHFGLESSQIDCQWYDNHFDDIVKFVLDRYTIRQHSGLTSKFASINAIMRLAGVDCAFMHKNQTLMQIPIEIKPVDKSGIPPCVKMVEYLKKELTQTGMPSACAVLTTYIHGYPMRLGDITHTSIHKKHGVNWLDTENKIWYIRQNFTKQRKARQFEVTKEYIDEVLPFVHRSGYMVCKRSGVRYKTVTMKSLRLNVTVNDVRNSYEAYNQNRDDIDQKEKSRISNDILGHTTSIALAYYTNNDLAQEIKQSL